METFSALLAIFAGNSPVPGKSPHKDQKAKKSKMVFRQTRKKDGKFMSADMKQICQFIKPLMLWLNTADL